MASFGDSVLPGRRYEGDLVMGDLGYGDILFLHINSGCTGIIVLGKCINHIPIIYAYI